MSRHNYTERLLKADFPFYTRTMRTVIDQTYKSSKDEDSNGNIMAERLWGRFKRDLVTYESVLEADVNARVLDETTDHLSQQQRNRIVSFVNAAQMLYEELQGQQSTA